MLDIILSGCGGKMGRYIAQCAAESPDVSVAAGIDPFLSGESRFDFPVFGSFGDCAVKADVIVDFSSPAALDSIISYAELHHLPVVFATTGYSNEQIAKIKALSQSVPVFRSGNMSLGINLMTELLRTCTHVLKGYDIEITEKHHNQKLDAPSGTALMLADAINSASDEQYDYVYDRHERREKRPANEIGIHSVRGGTIVGEHTVLFAGRDEFLEITHTAQSRQLFAVGALKAARFLQVQPCGLYNMSDVINAGSVAPRIGIYGDSAIIRVSDISINDGMISDMFALLAKNGISPELINQSSAFNGRTDVSFCVSADVLHETVELLCSLADRRKISVNSDICRISVDSSSFDGSVAVSRITAALYENRIPVYMVTGNEAGLSLCAPKEDAERAADIIRDNL